MIWQRWWSQWCSQVQDPSVQRQWWAVCAAGVMTLLPLLLAVDHYIDDLERAMVGNMHWVRVGRPLADVLVEALNFGRPATAVAPLYMLVAIGLLSAVGVACARTYGIRSPFWTAMSSLPLMAQPYALQAMSYGFDALFMAVSLAAAIAAALLVNLASRWTMVAAAFALQLLSFNLYQPAANAFLAMSGCLGVASALNLFDRTKSIVPLRRPLLTSAVLYCSGYGTYRLLIALFVEHRLNSYALSSAQFKPFDGSLPMALFSSAMEPLQQLALDFGRMPVGFPLLLLVLSYVAVVIQWCSLRMAFISLAGMLGVVLLAPGGLLFLQESFVRHPRVLLYFGPLATNLILQVLVLSELIKRPLWRLAVLPFLWLTLVFSYAYGHAFEAQARFEQSRLSRIVGAASGLQATPSDRPRPSLIVQGTMPRSPVLGNTVRKFPLVDRLIPPLLDGNQNFSFIQLRLHGLDLPKLRTKDWGGEMPEVCEPSEDAICTSEFSLQRVGEDVLVLQLPTELAERRPKT